MNKKQFLVLSLVIIVGLILAACGGTASTAPAPKPTVPAPAADPSKTSGETASTDLVLDPANETGAMALVIAGHMYEGLVGLKDGAPVGILAQSYTVSDDGLDYIFNLRPGVTFHDGSALNADVVIANFDRWFDPNNPNRGSGSFAAWAKNFGGFKGEVGEGGKAKSIYDGIEKVDNLTVLVHLNTQDVDFLTKLSDPAFSIVSTKAFNSGDGGTGAYKFGSLSGSTATLEPFAGYWEATAVQTKSVQLPIK
jgi:peptide/nickel transport system substrate-binding protein